MTSAHRARQPAIVGWDTLTKTEREIADLVAEGLKNREIAARRFVSIRTVETHVTHILAKLGIPSRRELIVARAVARAHSER